MNKERHIDISNIIGIICLMIGAGVMVITTRFIFSSDIWFDELFTVELASKSFKDMIAFAAEDVHPPFYYICVRILYLGLHTFVTDISVATVAKLTALIPYYLVFLYACTLVRRRFGMISAGLMVLFIEMMPQMSAYMVEARMYSLALFSVLAMFIHAMEAAYGIKSTFSTTQDISYNDACQHIWCFWLKKNCYKKETVKVYMHLIAAMLYAIAAMYTHYYAFIGAGIAFLGILIYLIIQYRKNTKQIEAWKAAGDTDIHDIVIRPAISGLFVMLAIVLVAYVPWEGAVLSQVGAVSESYWIAPLSLRTFAGCVKFIFKPEFESGLFNYLITAILLLLVVVSFVRYIYKFSKQNEGSWNIYYVCFCNIIIVLLVITGFVASILIRPVFVYRYMLPVLGIFWMGAAITIGDLLSDITRKIDISLSRKNIEYVVITVLALFVLFITMKRDYNMFSWEEQKKLSGIKQAEETFDLIEEEYSDRILVCNFNQVQDILWYYLDNPSILWGETGELLIGRICGRAPIQMTDDIDTLKKMITDENSGEFLFIGSGNAREEIISLWEDVGMQVDIISDSVLVERYYFNVYNVCW